MDDDYPTTSVDRHLEEQLESMQRCIHEMILRGVDLWCSKCSTEGHTSKDTYPRGDHRQDVHIIHAN